MKRISLQHAPGTPVPTNATMPTDMLIRLAIRQQYLHDHPMTRGGLKRAAAHILNNSLTELRLRATKGDAEAKAYLP